MKKRIISLILVISMVLGMNQVQASAHGVTRVEKNEYGGKTVLVSSEDIPWFIEKLKSLIVENEKNMELYKEGGEGRKKWEFWTVITTLGAIAVKKVINTYMGIKLGKYAITEDDIELDQQEMQRIILEYVNKPNPKGSAYEYLNQYKRMLIQERYGVSPKDHGKLKLFLFKAADLVALAVGTLVFIYEMKRPVNKYWDSSINITRLEGLIYSIKEEERQIKYARCWRDGLKIEFFKDGKQKSYGKQKDVCDKEVCDIQEYKGE